MLVEFRVANYKSFQEEQVFSLVANAEDELMSQNIFIVKALDNLKLLRSAAIYGPNASGKSNLIKAIKFMRDFIGNPDSCYTDDNKILVQPFLLGNESQQEPSKFEMTFICKKTRYQYYFSVDADYVHEERLLAYHGEESEVLFERVLNSNKRYEWNFSKKLKGARLTEGTKPNVLYLSRIADIPTDNKQLYEIYKWFTCYLHIIGTGKNGDSEVDDHLEQLPKKPSFDKFHSFIMSFLRDADTGIVDFTPDDVKFFLSKNGYMKHRSKNGAAIPFNNPQDESLGTWRLLFVGRAILGVLESGAVLLVDELDMSLHMMIVREFINLFHNSTRKTKNAQLIFNTHDVKLFKPFRCDQIWFIEKDNGGASDLYSMAEFEPLPNESLEFGYLQGRYGAIPFFGDYWEGEMSNGKQK